MIEELKKDVNVLITGLYIWILIGLFSYLLSGEVEGMRIGLLYGIYAGAGYIVIHRAVTYISNRSNT